MDSGAPYLAFLGVQGENILEFLHLKWRPMTAMVVVKEEEEENELKAYLDREVCNKTSAMFFKARLKEVRKRRNICSVLKINVFFSNRSVQPPTSSEYRFL